MKQKTHKSMKKRVKVTGTGDEITEVGEKTSKNFS